MYVEEGVDTTFDMCTFLLGGVLKLENAPEPNTWILGLIDSFKDDEFS